MYAVERQEGDGATTGNQYNNEAISGRRTYPEPNTGFDLKTTIPKAIADINNR